MSFSYSRIPSRESHYIKLPCLPQLLLAVTISKTFHVFDDFDCLRSTGQVFWRNFSIGISLMFVHDCTEVMGLEEEDHRSQSHFHHVISRVQITTRISLLILTLISWSRCAYKASTKRLQSSYRATSFSFYWQHF